MSLFSRIRMVTAAAALCWAMFFGAAAQATIARFQTSLGNIDVRLYNSATPLTVANFLAYASANRYDGTFIHRSPPGFVVQGGGFYFTPPNSVAPVVDPANPDPPVLNEPGISNKRGTIAMAKLGSNPNSATSQWFFNVGDNSGPPAALDTQNGGFTVFGRVVANGMSVVDAIDLLPQADLDGAGGQTFDQVPLRGTSSDTLANRLVHITSVDVLNLPAGDYDFNGVVNMADYSVWRQSYDSTTAAEADGNGDGIVDVADFVVWRNSMSGGAASGSVQSPFAVPEPSAAFMIAAASLLLVGLRDRSRRS
ncbi:MAG TPA: peptidylprolyl isomerase [Lacipirellulaceae bacterium]